jgi:hypothetical protein
MTRAFAAVVLFAVVTSVYASDLPRSAYPVLLRELHADKVLGADQIRRRTVDGFDYLGFQGSFEISWGFEGVYHPEVVLRKRHSDSDWSKATVLSCPSLNETFRLPDKQFIRALYPWRR